MHCVATDLNQFEPNYVVWCDILWACLKVGGAVGVKSESVRAFPRWSSLYEYPLMVKFVRVSLDGQVCVYIALILLIYKWVKNVLMHTYVIRMSLVNHVAEGSQPRKARIMVIKKREHLHFTQEVAHLLHTSLHPSLALPTYPFAHYMFPPLPPKNHIKQWSFIG